MRAFKQFFKCLKSSSREGVTLIEVAVGLVAVGLVAGMATQAMNTKTVTTIDNDAAIKQCYAQTRSDMATMNNAVQQFFLKNGYYPMPAPKDGSRGTQINYTTELNKVSVDINGAPTVLIGYFPYATVGLPKKYFADCFKNNNVKIAGHADADSYYRYVVSVNSSKDKNNYASSTTHGSVQIMSSPSATMTTAVYGVVSHGSTGCSGTLPAGKNMNCATATAISLNDLANFAFSRKTITNPTNYFDDLIVFFVNNDKGCGNNSVSWTDAATNLQCSAATSSTMKPGNTITLTSSTAITTGSAAVTCHAQGAGYTLAATGSCQCSASPAHGTVTATPPTCTLTCDPGYTQSADGKTCVALPPPINGACDMSNLGQCISGTPTADNNDSTCSSNRTWTCQGSGVGHTDAPCTHANFSCVCANGAANYPTCTTCSDGIGFSKIIPASCLTGTSGSATQGQTRGTCSAGWVDSGPINTSGCTPNTCAVTSVANGTVGAYPGCAISCNSGYTLSGSSCVINACPVTSVANGTVAAAPDCSITCNAGYSLSGNSCVALACPPGRANPPTCDQCSATAPANGTLSGAPLCQITCNAGYTLSGNSCVPTAACSNPVWTEVSGAANTPDGGECSSISSNPPFGSSWATPGSGCTTIGDTASWGPTSYCSAGLVPYVQLHCACTSTPSACSPNSVSNGTVAADCSISCNSGYTLSGGICVLNSPTCSWQPYPDTCTTPFNDGIWYYQHGGVNWIEVDLPSSPSSPAANDFGCDGSGNAVQYICSSGGSGSCANGATDYPTCTPLKYTCTDYTNSCPAGAPNVNGIYQSATDDSQRLSDCAGTLGDGQEEIDCTLNSAPTTCSPSSVANGTVDSTTCKITCNPSYNLSGSSCVATSGSCGITHVPDGMVAAYPSCAVSCYPGYALSNNQCVQTGAVSYCPAATYCTIGGYTVNVPKEAVGTTFSVGADPVSSYSSYNCGGDGNYHVSAVGWFTYTTFAGATEKPGAQCISNIGVGSGVTGVTCSDGTHPPSGVCP